MCLGGSIVVVELGGFFFELEGRVIEGMWCYFLILEILCSCYFGNFLIYFV